MLSVGGTDPSWASGNVGAAVLGTKMTRVSSQM